MKKGVFFTIIILITILGFPMVYLSSSSRTIDKQKNENEIHGMNNATVTFNTFKAASGWGYDIFINGKLYIHQPNIPAVSGNKGFLKEENAAKIAELVIEKLKNNIFPPSVGLSELESLQVINDL